MTPKQIIKLAAKHRIEHDGDYSRTGAEMTRDLIAFANAIAAAAASEDMERLKSALDSINDIRNSIIGLQTLNWSEHVYPLVKVLDEAGFEGMEYPAAREFYGTMLDRCNAAEKDAERYRFIRDADRCDQLIPFDYILSYAGADLDEAINAAIAADKERQP